MSFGMIYDRFCRRGSRVHRELASVGRVLVGRRFDDQTVNQPTAVRGVGHLSPDRHDVCGVQPDYIRLDELQHPERAVSDVLYEDSSPRQRGRRPNGAHHHGHDVGHQKPRESAADHVQHGVQLCGARQPGGILPGCYRLVVDAFLSRILSSWCTCNMLWRHTRLI